MTASGDDDGVDRGNQLLAGAYALNTPDDHVSYYRDFADHYDRVFADGLGYVYPAAIAARLAMQPLPEGPILDIGCGTGLVAAEIRRLIPDAVLDGIDISPEMLEASRTKGLYRSLIQADLTGDFSHLPKDYGVIVSAGTFTHGHLGSQPLVGLLSHCAPAALAVIGVNSQHFAAHGFADVVAGLALEKRISTPRVDEVPIFDGRDASHAEDTAFILSFAVNRRRLFVAND